MSPRGNNHSGLSSIMLTELVGTIQWEKGLEQSTSKWLHRCATRNIVF